MTMLQNEYWKEMIKVCVLIMKSEISCIFCILRRFIYKKHHQKQDSTCKLLLLHDHSYSISFDI